MIYSYKGLKPALFIYKYGFQNLSMIPFEREELTDLIIERE